LVTATGRRRVRIPVPDNGGGDGPTDSPAVALSPDGRQVVVAAAGRPTRIWSADDGALLHTLEDGDAKGDKAVAFSPSGRLLVIDGLASQLWETAGWRRVSWIGFAGQNSNPRYRIAAARAVTEDVFAATYSLIGGGQLVSPMIQGDIRQDVNRWLVFVPSRAEYPVRADAKVIVVGSDLHDRLQKHDLYPPAGRNYHPALGQFALDGRWLPNETGELVDLTVDRSMPAPWYDTATPVPGSGFVWATENGRDGARGFVGWVPLPSRLPPDDLLDLWAHVVARGELGPTGEFTKWDEPTWERKRQELAARPVPFPDFPFPGRVATDRLYWLRCEFHQQFYGKTINETDAQTLLRRAEELGDADEAAHWQAEVAKRTREVAPPPRERK
jgi:hypothetical protein